MDEVRERAITVAENNNQIARRNKRYKEAHKHVAELNVAIAFAELYDPEKAAKLEAEREHWLSEEIAALKKAGLTAELLDEEFLFKLYSKGGAPPGNVNNVGAGEQNSK